jgi:hypothetical protein
MSTIPSPSTLRIPVIEGQDDHQLCAEANVTVATLHHLLTQRTSLFNQFALEVQDMVIATHEALLEALASGKVQRMSAALYTASITIPIVNRSIEAVISNGNGS